MPPCFRRSPAGWPWIPIQANDLASSLPCKKVVKEKSQASRLILNKALDSANRVRSVLGVPSWDSRTIGLITSGETRLAAFPGSLVTCSQLWQGTSPEDLQPVRVTISSSPKYLGPSVQVLSQPSQLRKISAGEGEVAISKPSSTK